MAPEIVLFGDIQYDSSSHDIPTKTMVVSVLSSTSSSANCILTLLVDTELYQGNELASTDDTYQLRLCVYFYAWIPSSDENYQV